MDSKVLEICTKEGFLLDKEILKSFSNLSENSLLDLFSNLKGLGVDEKILTKEVFKKYSEELISHFLKTKDREDIMAFFSTMGIEINNENKSGSFKNLKDISGTGKVKLISAPAFSQKKIEVSDFVKHFKFRYDSIKGFLEEMDFDNLTSVRRIGKNYGNYTIIASVLDKRITKNKNILLEVEDPTGNVPVLVNQNRREVFQKGRDLLPDDIVAFKVSGSKEMLFADDIFFPESSLAEKRYGKIDEFAAFTSDLHVGSKFFLEDNFLKFISWLNGESGDDHQRSISKRVKYLFFVGDNVDGVSVYPSQEKDLKIPSLRGQYRKFAELLKLIRKDIKIIISPGQHDAVWIGEPQPIIGEEWAPDLYNIENVTLVPNPSWVEIDDGFVVLMYHGASINGIIEAIPEIRIKYGHNNPTRVVKEMLKRRHLAPMHGSCDYIPCEKKDPLIIDPTPDIVATGDQHRSEVSIHNNILLIAGSCWQSLTPFEEKVGNNPDPCKVPIFNLKSREIKILDFSDESMGDKFEIKSSNEK